MRKNYGENYDLNADLDAMDDDSYLDNRLNDVFNEIVKLRAEQNQLSNNPPSNNQQSGNQNYNNQNHAAPYTPMPTNDSALYGEIARLKEELNRNKSTQDLRSEMNLLKSELGRESYLLEEIRKINDRLDIMQTAAPVNNRVGVAEPRVSNDYVAPQKEQNSINSDIAEIKEMLAAVEKMKGKSRQFTSFDDIYAVLITEISALRLDILSKSGTEAPDSDRLLRKLDDIFDETIKLKTLAEKSESDIRAEIAESFSGNALKEDVADISAQIMTLREEIKASKIMEQDEVLKELAALRQEISDVKIFRSYAAAPENDEVQPTYSEVNLMLSEIVSLRQEIEAYKDEITKTEGVQASAIAGDEINELRATLEEVKDYVSRRPSYTVSDENDSNVSSLTVVMDELQALRAEISILKKDIGNIQVDNSGVEEIRVLLEELADRETAPSDTNANGVDEELFKTEFASLRKELSAINEQPNLTVLHEVLELRDEFQAVKEALLSVTESNNNDSSEFTEEIKALGEKVEALGMAIESDDDNIAPELLSQFEELRENVSAIGEEIKTLRDQVFAINMTKVEDGETERFENYNDIIFGEIVALRDDVDSFKTEALSDEKQNELNERLAALEEQIKTLSSAEMTKDMSETFKTEIGALKTEVENRRNADELTVNFMNEMALLIERQNELIAVGETEPKSRMEKLRNEIAATIATQDIPSRHDIEDLSRSIDALKSNLTEIAETINSDPVKAKDENN